MSSIGLAQFSLAVRQRADLAGQLLAFGLNGSNYITDAEMTTMVQGSLTKVWDILIGKFGDNYAWGSYTWSPTAGVYNYAAPWDYYKEDSIKMCVDGSGINFIRMQPISSRDSGDYAWPINTNLGLAGFANVRWQMQGTNIQFFPNAGPLPGFLRFEYFQKCPLLVYSLPTAFPVTSPVTMGQLIQAPVTLAGVVTTQVFAAMNSGTSGTLPTFVVPGTVTDSGGIIWAYQCPLAQCATTFDGISGYEELVILDCAIKARTKQQKDVADLGAQMASEMQRINLAAANRQAGDPVVARGGWGRADNWAGFMGNGFSPGGDGF
jgi:hypothetical protein